LLIVDGRKIFEKQIESFQTGSLCRMTVLLTDNGRRFETQ